MNDILEKKIERLSDNQKKIVSGYQYAMDMISNIENEFLCKHDVLQTLNLELLCLVNDMYEDNLDERDLINGTQDN